MTDEEFEAMVRDSGITPTSEQLGFMFAGYALAQSRLLDMADAALEAGKHEWREVLLEAADSL